MWYYNQKNPNIAYTAESTKLRKFEVDNRLLKSLLIQNKDKWLKRYNIQHATIKKKLQLIFHLKKNKLHFEKSFARNFKV